MVENSAVFIQSRLNSSRLPAKAMLDLFGKTLFQRVVSQVKKSKLVQDVWLVTSRMEYDGILAREAEKLGLKVFQGDLDDVLGRYYYGVKESGAEYAVRVCGDNPFIEPVFIDLALESLINQKGDYSVVTNVPLGTASEAFTFQALEKVFKESFQKSDREHVTKYMVEHPEKFHLVFTENPIPETSFPQIRLTMDTIDDYYRYYSVYQKYSHKDDLDLAQIVRYLSHQ